ncbi:placenta-specific gene 8 protein-like [Saccostrea echinata]|uniref:placenta-specific gene 8 protein-like n=1 Tax=Saccostrea echinata TaxID=191078 RepID=UPI002A825A9A|nr:placenta-specific gene 8 protein-like [Saccostrea echinata]
MATTVIVQQPTAAAVPDDRLMVTDIKGHREWSTGLFDIFSDIKTSLLTFFCESYVKCNLATRTGEGGCMPFCVTGAMTIMRSRIRTIGGIKGSAFKDCMVITFCQPCAICQMNRELDHMGVP